VSKYAETQVTVVPVNWSNALTWDWSAVLPDTPGTTPGVMHSPRDGPAAMDSTPPGSVEVVEVLAATVVVVVVVSLGASVPVVTDVAELAGEAAPAPLNDGADTITTTKRAVARVEMIARLIKSGTFFIDGV
jgi:hypothetical protein